MKVVKLSKQAKTVRGKLFFIMCIVVLSIILFLILVNSFVLEKYYQYTKSNQLKSLYNNINDYYNSDNPATNFKDELDRVAIKNNFDIIIKDENDKAVYL